MTAAVLAIDIGGTAVRAAVVNDQGRMNSFAHAATTSHSLEAVVAAVAREAVAEFGGPMPRTCAVSVPEYVHEGIVTSSMVVPWSDCGANVVDAVKALIGTDSDIILESDVRCGASAEYALRGADEETLFYVSWGTGISSTLVLPGGRVHSGAHGAAIALGDVGHADTGLTLEQLASGAGIARRWVSTHPSDPASTRELVDRARDDPAAREFLAEASEALGRSLRDVVSIIDPNRVVIGGGVGAAAGWHWTALRLTFGDGSDVPQSATVEPAVAGPHSSLLGAALIAHAAAFNRSQ